MLSVVSSAEKKELPPLVCCPPSGTSPITVAIACVLAGRQVSPQAHRCVRWVPPMHGADALRWLVPKRHIKYVGTNEDGGHHRCVAVGLDVLSDKRH